VLVTVFLPYILDDSGIAIVLRGERNPFGEPFCLSFAFVFFSRFLSPWILLHGTSIMLLVKVSTES